MVAQSTYRKIIHIDMDAFYASMEQRDFPTCRDKPLVVGRMLNGRGGVVATASYEVWKFGIRSSHAFQNSATALPGYHFCVPNFVYSRFDTYKTVSKHIREIFHRVLLLYPNLL